MSLPLWLEAPPRFELGVRVLQTRALPLGYGAAYNAAGVLKETPAGISMERITRLELATSTLARWRSTR